MTASAEDRGYDRCGAQARSGKPCARPAGWGTAHAGIGSCKLHGGSTPTHERAAQLQIARRECDRLGVSIETDPGEALIHAVWEAAGNVEFYRSLVAQLPTEPTRGQMSQDDDGAEEWQPGATGVYGPTYHQSGMPTGEAKPHILVVLYNEERDRLVSYAKAALAAGVEERRVRMAEADARLLFGAVSKALASAGLTAEQSEVFRHELAGHLRTARPVPIAG